MSNIVKYSGLRQKLDEIDEAVINEISGPAYESRLRILVGMWEKGQAIVSFLGGAEKKPNYLALERQVGRSDSQLKKWHETFKRWPDKQHYIKEEAEPKAKKWVADLILAGSSGSPHVLNNSGDNEWDTPPEYVEAARTAMGSIDTDPATNSEANNRIKANLFYTTETDGRDKPWRGNVWMNPPYAQPLIAEFCEALVGKWQAGEFKQACILVNNATETAWFQSILAVSECACFVSGRIKFIDREGKPSGAPLQGQAILYLGAKPDRFAAAFSEFGPILWRDKQ